MCRDFGNGDSAVDSGGQSIGFISQRLESFLLSSLLLSSLLLSSLLLSSHGIEHLCGPVMVLDQDCSIKRYHMLVPEKYCRGKAALRAIRLRFGDGSQVMTYVMPGFMHEKWLDFESC